MSLIKTKYKKEIYDKFIKGIREYEMVQDGDRIAVGVSGGKDSLLLLNLFKELKDEGYIKFDFVGITLDQGYEKSDLEKLGVYVETIGCEYKLYDTNIWQVVFDEREEKNPCSLCAKMRRGILYKRAEELGCNKLALGHHFDDIIETALINMFFSGNIKTMVPKIRSEKGNFDLIRPLVYVMEDDITRYSQELKIPVMKCGCKLYELKPDSKRLEVKIMLKNMEKKNKYIKKSIFNSLRNVNMKYLLPPVKKDNAVTKRDEKP